MVSHSESNGSASVDRRSFFPFSLDDPATQVAYNSDTATDWLRSRNCRLEPPALSVGYPYGYDVPTSVQATVNSLLSYRFPTRQNIREYYQICCDVPVLTESYKDVFHRLLRNYEIPKPDAGNPSLILEASEIHDSEFLNHLLRSVDFNARIQMRYGHGAELCYPAITWLVLYNSFFEYVWQDVLQEESIDISYNPKWALHKESHRELAPWEVSHIIPDVAFITYIPSFLSQPVFTSWSEEQLEAALSEITPAYIPPSTIFLFHALAIPFLVVEYVKSPQSINGRTGHHAHLAMAMKSVVGLYRTLEIPLSVFGLLVDRYQATLVVTWNNGVEDVCSLIPFKLGRFDLCNPYDAFRLRLVLSNLKQHAAQVRDLAKQSRSRVIATFLDGKQHQWRQEELPDRTPSPIEGPRIEEWRRDI